MSFWIRLAGFEDSLATNSDGWEPALRGHAQNIPLELISESAIRGPLTRQSLLVLFAVTALGAAAGSVLYMASGRDWVGWLTLGLFASLFLNLFRLSNISMGFPLALGHGDDVVTIAAKWRPSWSGPIITLSISLALLPFLSVFAMSYQETAHAEWNGKLSAQTDSRIANYRESIVQDIAFAELREQAAKGAATNVDGRLEEERAALSERLRLFDSQTAGDLRMAYLKGGTLALRIEAVRLHCPNQTLLLFLTLLACVLGQYVHRHRILPYLRRYQLRRFGLHRRIILTNYKNFKTHLKRIVLDLESRGLITDEHEFMDEAYRDPPFNTDSKLLGIAEGELISGT